MKPGRSPNQKPSAGGDAYKTILHLCSFTPVLQKGAPVLLIVTVIGTFKVPKSLVQPWVNLVVRSRAYALGVKMAMIFSTKLIPSEALLGWFMQEFSGWPLLEMASP